MNQCNGTLTVGWLLGAEAAALSPCTCLCLASLSAAVMINVPSVMQALLRAVWSLFPKKMQQKLRVCPGKTLSQDISKCPFASSRLVLDSIPTFLGGTCHCPKGCIAGLANDQRECNPGVDAETGGPALLG